MSFERAGLALLLTMHLLLTVAFSILNPLGEAPDEADHWAYVVHLAKERALPVGPRVTQSKHPPLYHATAALVASIGDPENNFLRANPDVQIARHDPWSPNFFIHTTLEDFPWRADVLSFHLARLWSAILSTFTVLATFKLGRALFPHQPTVAWAGAGMLAFLPEFLFIGSSVNNDNGIALFGTLSLLACAQTIHSRATLRTVWWAPLAVGCGLLTKTSALGVWPALSLALTWSLVQADLSVGPLTAQRFGHVVRRHWRAGLLLHIFVFGGGLLLAAPWLMRNVRLYGDPLGLSLALQTIDLRTAAWTWGDTQWLLRGWFLSSVGKLGGAGHIPLPSWIYGGYAMLAGLGMGGLMRQVWRHRRDWQWMPPAILILAVGGVAAGMWRYSLVALGTDQGRLIYPAVAPLMLLIAAGIVAWIPARLFRVAIGGLVAWGMLSTIVAITLVLLPSFSPLPAAGAAEVAAAQLDPPIRFDELTLIGWSEQPDPVLYWRVSAESDRDLRIVLRVMAQDGTLIWEKRRSPGRGLFSTDQWEAEEVVRDSYEIGWPEWAQPARYRVEVGVQPYGAEMIAVDGREFVPVGSIARRP